MFAGRSAYCNSLRQAVSRRVLPTILGRDTGVFGFVA